MIGMIMIRIIIRGGMTVTAPIPATVGVPLPRTIAIVAAIIDYRGKRTALST